LIAKIILPWFGGSAAVWIVCLLFFQLVLLLGYLYAHLLIRYVPPSAQQWVHAIVFLLSVVAMAVFRMSSRHPARSEAPVRQILLLLAESIGPAYFLLSSSSPLLQAWYAQANEGAVPYRFYALSNIGSMLALLSYPVIVEPYFSTAHQAVGWSIAYLC